MFSGVVILLNAMRFNIKILFKILFFSDKRHVHGNNTFTLEIYMKKINEQIKETET